MQKKIISVFLILSILLSAVVFEAQAVYYPSDTEIIAKSADIIRQNEGWYNSVNPNDNGALSVGWLQWHANRALSLVRTVINANSSNALSIIGEALYSEIMNTETSWQTRVLTTDEKAKLSALLDTAEGHIAQDNLAAQDISSYINHGKQLGIVSPAALVYFADMENQCGAGGAKKVIDSINISLYPLGITLEVLHNAALASTNAGKYPARRSKVYNYALLLGWEDSSNSVPYEIWTVDSTVNVRSGAGVENTLITQYYKGTKVAVFEKKVNGEYYWGRTEAGWITLDYCSFVRSTVDGNNIRVFFDANGGELQTAPDLTRAVNGINIPREHQYLVIYTPERGATTGTNIYGIDISVDENNRVIAINRDGNSAIPSGGYVVSGNTDSAWFLYNIEMGDYVIFDRYNMTFSRYKDYNAYLASTKITAYGNKLGELPVPEKKGYEFIGWFDKNENEITSNTYNTGTEAISLAAKYKPVSVSVIFDESVMADVLKSEYTASSINTTRGQDQLVVYNSDFGASTGTNKWGCEAIVDANGFVTEIKDTSPNNSIPKGGLVLSGHDAGRSWILSNVAVGNKIKVDYETKKISVYTVSSNSSLKLNLTYGEVVQGLPAPEKEGYAFFGWYTENGEEVKNGVRSTLYEDTVLYAKWVQKGALGDINCDGKLNTADLFSLKKRLKGMVDDQYGAFDLNGDGKINQRDLFAFRRIIALGA